MSETEVITPDDVKAIARRASGDESAEVLDYHLEPYSKRNLGNLGVHQKLEIRLKGGKDEASRKLNFFVKSVPSNCDVQVQFVKDNQIFRQEAAYFNEVAPKLQEAVEVAGGLEHWAPKCYLASGRVIVQEDLREQGFDMCSDKLLEGERLHLVAKTLARMHSASILAERQLGKPINEVYPEACSEMIFNKMALKYGLALLLDSLIKEVAGKHKRNAERAHEVIVRAIEFMVEGKGEGKVMSHGDTWTNNIMFDKTGSKCLLVDYQMVRYAPRMFDVAQMIHLTTTSESRKREERETIEAYWKELTKCLKRCEPEIETPSLEQLLEEYETLRVIAQTLAVLYYPTIQISEEVHAEYEDNLKEFYEKYIYRRNNVHILELMGRDKKYNDRIVDAVLDFLDSCDKIGPKTEKGV